MAGPVPSYLAIYLRDHHAAGSAGARIAERIAAEGGVELARIAGEIADDLRTLEDVMRSAGVEPSRVKDASAIALEHLGRLKPNGHLRRRSPLSDVVELETLLVGINGKAALWTSLAEALPDSAFDFEVLLERAERQLEAVSRHRDEASRRAFAKRVALA
jgi:hypothetical protein